MIYLEYVIYAFAVLWTGTSLYNIRNWALLYGRLPVPPSLNTAMLEIGALVLLPVFGYSFLHLLWIFPIALIINIGPPTVISPLLAPAQSIFGWLVSLGLDKDKMANQKGLLKQLNDEAKSKMSAETAAEEALYRSRGQKIKEILEVDDLDPLSHIDNK